MPTSQPLIRKGQQRKNAKKASFFLPNIELSDDQLLYEELEVNDNGEVISTLQHDQSSYEEFQVNDNGEVISTLSNRLSEEQENAEIDLNALVRSAAVRAATVGSRCRSKQDLMCKKKYSSLEADAYIATYDAQGFSKKEQRNKRTRAAAQRQAYRRARCPAEEILISQYKPEGAKIYVDSYREAYARRWGQQNVPELPAESTANSTLVCASTKTSGNADLACIKNFDTTEDIQSNDQMAAALSSFKHRSVENIDEIQLQGTPAANINEFDNDCWNFLLSSRGLYFNVITNSATTQASETLTVHAEQDLVTTRVTLFK